MSQNIVCWNNTHWKDIENDMDLCFEEKIVHENESFLGLNWDLQRAYRGIYCLFVVKQKTVFGEYSGQDLIDTIWGAEKN